MIVVSNASLEGRGVDRYSHYRGYIKVPRLLRFWEEFRERSELLVMLALYRLGNGNSFRQLRSMCHIGVSEARKFFSDFLDAMVEMKDE